MVGALWVLLAPLAWGSGQELAPKEPETNGVVILDGKAVHVFWDDGDTFRAPSIELKARLVGYNTLESYGAVHRFGPGEAALLEMAHEATKMATSQKWECRVLDGEGGYGRRSVDCPQLKQSLLRAGLAHPFSVNGPAPAGDLKDQALAIESRQGMWASGPQSTILTSVHSMSEKKGKPEIESTYNRVLNVETGEAAPQSHSETYDTCAWVCHKDSCLLYVPYTQRYGEKKASCLR